MKMNINNAYEPLVERFIAVDNYEKMKTILDVGFSGLEVIEKYYEKQQKEFDICENNNEVLLLQEKIKNMQLVLDETQFKFMEEKEQIA
jgi:predicted CopG family antitoxin